MDWLPRLKDLLRRNPAAIAFGILTLLLLVAERIHKLTYVEEVLDSIVQFGVVPGGGDTVHLKHWFAMCLLLLIALALFGLALWARSKMALEHPAQHALQATMASVSRIKNQLMPTKLKPKRQLLMMENTYVIRKNFDTEVTRRFQIKAVQSPIHFWGCIIEVSDSACPPMKYIEALGFDVQDEDKSRGPTDVVYLPLRDHPFSKEALVYFLPQIDPAEASPRTVAVTYRWPGMCNELKEKRSDEWGWIVESETSVPEVVFRFLTEDLGGKLEMRVSGSQDGTQSISDCGKNAAGLHQIEYRIKNAPAGRYGVVLRLQ